MKKAPWITTVIALAMTIAGVFFIAGTAEAATVYQQLVDSGSAITLPFSTGTVIGTFVASQASAMSGGIGYFYFSNNNGSHGSSGETVDIGISTTTSYADSITAGSFSVSTTTGTQENGIQGVFSSGTLVPGQVYNLIALSGDANSQIKILSDSMKANAFGYIADGGGNSVTIIPNTPGFSDVGVATSTVYANCFANLSNATTSSFFSQAEQDVSLGLCQTGVLLFIPNPQSLQNFGLILPNLVTKFPFSWFGAVPIVWNTLSATNTNALPAYSIGLHELGIGSTTPMGNILPDFVILSTTTISTYLSDTERNVIINIIAVGLWMGLLAEVWFTLKNKSFSTT